MLPIHKTLKKVCGIKKYLKKMLDASRFSKILLKTDIFEKIPIEYNNLATHCMRSQIIDIGEKQIILHLNIGM